MIHRRLGSLATVALLVALLEAGRHVGRAAPQRAGLARQNEVIARLEAENAELRGVQMES